MRASLRQFSPGLKPGENGRTRSLFESEPATSDFDGCFLKRSVFNKLVRLNLERMAMMAEINAQAKRKLLIVRILITFDGMADAL